METYRGYEIHPDLAGYAYLAHPPDYDGERCLWGFTLEAVRAEIGDAIGDEGESVNLFDAVHASKQTV